MKSKIWLSGWLVLTIGFLAAIGVFVYRIDPYMHYHKPNTEEYYYTLNNQRSQNDGITKHFEYDALITGTSMTENFKTSEFDKIFGVNSIKVSYSGGSYKEMNDNLIIALKKNPKLKTIVRCLDYGRLLDDKDNMRNDLGTYPTYLYDENPFNDVFYIFNKDVIFGRAYAMAADNDKEGFQPGITSFDDYSRWQEAYTFGAGTVIPNGVTNDRLSNEVHLTDEERQIINGNITQNVTSLADEYPDVSFYYFFSPYSAAWWVDLVHDGSIYKWIEAEQYAIELILEHPNIKLYSFNNRTDITTNLNNYKDAPHYGEWVNSYILRAMYDGDFLLTKDNYQEYLREELEFYTTFDYTEMNGQEDYEQDFYARALLNKEINGTEPIKVLEADADKPQISNAEISKNEVGKYKLTCKGTLSGDRDHSIIPYGYLMFDGYIGAKISVEKIDDYEYLAFWGQKIADNGQPIVLIYDDEGSLLKEFSLSYVDIDNEQHQYLIDISDLNGGVTILFNGGYTDSCGSEASEYVFEEIGLY